MVLKHWFPLASVAFLVGCETTLLPPSSGRPMFPQYRPDDHSRPTLSAPYAGRLTQQGPCLGLVTDGRFTTIIWPETAQLSMDRRGLLLTDNRSGARLRLGDYLKGTGGPLPRGYQQPLGETVLREGFDIECARYPGYDGWIGIVNAGFRKAVKR